MRGVVDKKTWGLVILCLVTFSIPGCFGKAEAALSLHVASLPTSLDEEIKLVLNNPGKEELFIPVDWEGIVIFRMDGDGKWYEYSKAESTMFSSSKEQIVYNIPAGTLVPGTYKLVLQGRRGKEGAVLNLEADIKVNPPSVNALGGS